MAGVMGSDPEGPGSVGLDGVQDGAVAIEDLPEGERVLRLLRGVGHAAVLFVIAPEKVEGEATAGPSLRRNMPAEAHSSEMLISR